MVKRNGDRHTYFRLRPDLTLQGILPSRSNLDVEDAIRGKSSWVLRERERMAGVEPVLRAGSIMFAGRRLTISPDPFASTEFAPDPNAGRVTVRSRDSSAIRELTRRWFMKESSAYAVRRVRELSPVVGVRANRVDVREMQKWGYCTREGRVSFSLQLAALSDELKDYVVLHELTHLSVFDHSPRFRRALSSVCPDRRRLEKELDRVVPFKAS